MQSWQIVLVVLVAVLVGSLIPLLLQMHTTLRQVARSSRSTGRHIERAADEVHTAAAHVNRLIGGLEGGDKQLASFLDSIGQLAQTLDRVRGTVNVASAVGAAIAPAVVALVRGLGEGGGAPAPERDEGLESTGNGRERGEAHLPNDPGEDR